VRYTTTIRTSTTKNAADSGDHLGAATAGCVADGPEPSPGEPGVTAPRSSHRGYPTTWRTRPYRRCVALVQGAADRLTLARVAAKEAHAAGSGSVRSASSAP
jgi:hypothetical protein